MIIGNDPSPFAVRHAKDAQLASFGMAGGKMEGRKFFVYVDGFSFYHGLTKDTPYRWCNLFKLSQLIFPNEVIQKVKLFAAKSKHFINDPKAPERQNAYFRALETIPQMELHLFEYIKQKRWLPKVSMLKSGIVEMEKVISYQEKGADVSLSINLVIDAFRTDVDCFAIITNDTDFIEPIKYVRNVQKRDVNFVPTCKSGHRRGSMELMKLSTNTHFITDNYLMQSLLDDTIIDKKGNKIHIPPEWK